MPFQDLKVIELASVLAGPLVGTFFSEQGAQVLKIENRKSGGDVTRTWRSPGENQENPVSAYYASANYHKKTVFADLSSEKERHSLYEVIYHTDLVIANFKQGDAEKLKVDYETLKQFNPGLIYAEISGFGPDDERTAYDVVLQAETGFMHMNGEADGPPVKMPVALIDLLAAHQLKEGILLAMLKKAKTGKGSKVSVSLYDTAISSLANQASNCLMNGLNPGRMGSGHPNIAPYGDVFLSKDGHWILFAIGTETHFQQLCRVLQLDSMLKDPAFSNNQQRVANRPELIRQMQEKIADWNRDDLYWEMIHLKIPVGRVRDLREVFTDERGRAMILEETLEGGFRTKRPQSVAFVISD